MHNQGEEKSVTERISRCHVNPTFLVLMIIFLWSCRRRRRFHFQFETKKAALPSRGVVLKLTSYFVNDHMSGFGIFCFLINTLPVLVDYLGSDQCFCHIELGGRAWKCLLCNLGRTSRRTSQCLCDASRWDTPARRPSKSPRLPLDLQLSWKSFKLVSRQLESPFSTFRGWMDENQALLFWCLASIIRIVWRTTDSCCAARTCLCSTYPRDQRSRDKQFPGDEEELAFSDSKGHAPKRPLRFASHLVGSFVCDLLKASNVYYKLLIAVQAFQYYSGFPRLVSKMKETYRKRCVEQSGSA